MTCIVGFVHSGGVTMGCDSQQSSGWVHTMLARSQSKVFRLGKMLIGVTGDSRMSQLVRYALVIPEHPSDLSCIGYFSTCFADALRDCLKNGGHATKDKEQETMSGSLLIAYQCRLYSISLDYAVTEATYGYYAVGSGQEPALGSMHTSARMGELLTPEKRILWALEAATEFSKGVGGPFIFETLGTHEATELSDVKAGVA